MSANSIAPETPSLKTFVGCDAGTLASCAILTSEDGEVLDSVYGEGVNPEVVGLDQSVEATADLIRRTFRTNSQPPAVVTVGLSGLGLPNLFTEYAEALRRILQLPEETRLVVSSELVAPLGLIIPTASTLGLLLRMPRQGAEISNGPPRLAVVLASSEAIAAVCSVRHRNHMSFRTSVENCMLSGGQFSYFVDKLVGGWGSVLGDAASEYGIAKRALNLALQVREGRLPAIVKKVQSPCAIAVYRDQESKSLAISVLYAALAHFSIRADDFDDGVAALAAHISEAETRRVEIATFAPILASLAASGHGLCKQVFSEAGCALGDIVMKSLATEDDKTGVLDASRTAICVVGEMFNAWREVPDFSNAFQGSINLFLGNGGQIFVLKNSYETPVMLTQKGYELAYGCARAGAIAWSRVDEQWASKALSHFHRISRDVPRG